jgi:glyoxylase-like metal-dependent hydrolase (beta-lactamase superfamily II)
MIRPAWPSGIGATAERLRKARRIVGSGWSAQGGVVLRYDASRACEQQGGQGPEDKAPDVGEERRAAAVRAGPEHPEVRLIELVQEPEAEEEPGRDSDEIAAANGVSNKVNYLVYSHHHADHVGAASLFDKNATRIGHEDTRRLLLRDDDPARPPNEETFQDRRTLEIGGERIDLAWHGPNHSPDNIIIHLPDHDTLMLIDIVNPGWAPVYLSNLTEDIPGYIEAPANALAYPWKHFIGGHLGRLGTRDDVTLHQQYMADISESSRKAIDTVDPTRYFVKYGDNSWAAVKGYLDEVTAVAAAPVIAKYTDVLAAADVFTESTTFWVMESIRLDLGYGSQVHP